MWKAENVGQAQEEAYKRAISNQLGAQQQGQSTGYTIPSPSTPAGVMDLIESAHTAFGALQDSIGTLRAVLHPVTLPASETGEGCMQEAPSDAPAVSALRALIERIDATRDGILELTNSVRI